MTKTDKPVPDMAAVSQALAAAYARRKEWLKVERSAARADGVVRELERVDEALNASGHAILALYRAYEAVLEARKASRLQSSEAYFGLSRQILDIVPEDISAEAAQACLTQVSLLGMQENLMAIGDQIDLIDDMGFFISFATGVVVLSDKDNTAFLATLENLFQALKDEATSQALGPFASVKTVFDAILAARKAVEERRAAMNDHMLQYQTFHDATALWAASAEAFAEARIAAQS